MNARVAQPLCDIRQGGPGDPADLGGQVRRQGDHVYIRAGCQRVFLSTAALAPVSRRPAGVTLVPPATVPGVRTVAGWNAKQLATGVWGAVVDAAWEPGCPPTGQALHFSAMCHYRRLGYPFYDFGGTPGPVPDPVDPNYTVWRFKNEFQGRYVEYAGVFTAILDRTGAEALRIARDAVDRVRSLGRSYSTAASAAPRE
jgi:hypothetical protein